jgi:ADP-ribosyl-[dinitrogen reductase] hydrolase
MRGTCSSVAVNSEDRAGVIRLDRAHLGIHARCSPSGHNDPWGFHRPAAQDHPFGTAADSSGLDQAAGGSALTDVAGGIWGLLVGDAFGVPYEFRSAEELRSVRLELPPPADFERTHTAAPAQAWSDDGAQALCLLASLLECGQLDIEDFGQRLLRWFDSGYMAVGGRVFDVGVQTHEALSALRRGVRAERSGPAGERDNGNGSLMRVLPLALWHRGSDADLVRDAARQSVVTHAHPRSQICCALYCLWVRAALRGAEDPWSDATHRLRRMTEQQSGWRTELEVFVRPDASPHGKGSGYVVDSLHSARLAAQEGTFEAVIRRAVSLGDDTDTTAAIAGGFAGVRYGVSSIPSTWLAALPDRHLVEPLVARLVEWCAGD